MGSWWNPVTTVGWQGAQGTSEAIERFTETVQALDRRRELDGARRRQLESRGEENGEERRRLWLNSAAQKQEEAMKEPSPCQREAEDGHARAWN